ncbi:diguanylate cyclase [Solilutibacter silvestris]|uniref:diguanylate cyclase n=1 Tax=Solilutibacter silvestris TaxID=1645665 RepID=A0A2K1PXK6_9GAMM|nr:diguanylate cyclase [Lysobacter silvestris]PNS07520.1 GGDEF: diguanylate cyclase (GGDEF) domain-containing protein [Lysobacter silvestris]
MPSFLFPRLERWSDRVQLAVLMALLIAVCIALLGRIFTPPAPSFPLSWHSETDGVVQQGESGVDGIGMVAKVPGNDRSVTFDVVATLPEAMREQGIVALRFERTAIDRIEVEDVAVGSVVVDGFYHANRERLPGLTSSFQFNVMVPHQGDLHLRIRAQSQIPVALMGRLEPHLQAGRDDRRVAGTAAMSYAVYLVLALVMIALYVATGQRSMLAFSWFAMFRLLVLMSLNGHLYQIPAMAWFARFDNRGTLSLMILVVASGILLVQEHGALVGEPHARQWRRLSRVLVLIAVAICCVLLFAPLPPITAWVLGQAAWIILGLMALGFCVRAFRNHIPHRFAVLVAVLVSFAASLAHLAYETGLIAHWWWAGRLVQITGAVLCTVVAVSLVRRIESYRIELARVRQTHQQLRRQMDAQTAIRALESDLATTLGDVADPELEFAAIHRLLAAATACLGLEGAGLVQFPGRRAPQAYAQPTMTLDGLRGWLAPRRSWVESVATGAAPMENHTPVVGRGMHSMLVPAQVLEGSHSVLVIERSEEAPAFTAADYVALASMVNATREALRRQREARTLLVTARIDALTGVLNRNSLDNDLAAVLAQSARTRSPLAVLFLDLDHFKRINDQLGHAAGDECLRAVARLLRANVRSGDLLGRYGGEEFVVVSPGATLAVAQQLGERIRAAVQTLRVEWEDHTIPVTVSVGIAMRRRDENEATHLLDRADQALYDAKRRGRNQVRFDLDAAAFDPAAE